MLRLFLFLVISVCALQTAAASTVRIADGDCAGFAHAVAAASGKAGTSATILLARNGTYPTCDLAYYGADASLSTNLVIDGQGARLHYVRLSIAAASLTLKNLTIDAATTDSGGGVACLLYGLTLDGVAVHVVTPICNSGNLTLDTVSFENLSLPYIVASNIPIDGTIDDASVIANSGYLALRNVTISNIKPSALRSTIIENKFGGRLEIYNSSFSNAQFGNSDGSVINSAPFATDPLISQTTTIANSLFGGNSVNACDQNVISIGGNVATDASCGFSSSTGDKIVADANLGTFGDHGGLIPTQAISGGSPAHGAGVAQYCEALDARGYTRSPHGCDAGAYEYGGGSGALTANGLNGFYYDPDANGHYVSLQRIHDNGDIAIVWSTFDSKGNQAWVYGVGQLSGKRIHADMSQNLGGVLQPGGAPTGSTVHNWGTVDIDLTSCALAQFSYQSGIEGFGNGQFPLTRLAFVSDFGCAD